MLQISLLLGIKIELDFDPAQRSLPISRVERKFIFSQKDTYDGKMGDIPRSDNTYTYYAQWDHSSQRMQSVRERVMGPPGGAAVAVARLITGRVQPGSGGLS